ncbi:hypothetical protein ECG_07210 [Echinococcus granulosus]|uniref:Expressed conserved protein n=1 Tax=Echinococcus granulosus TaxID=6210 RepID=U6JJE9_ECHGR|nr:hypothetical protein EGR_00698 [Echinococcus granulosus]EUB64154.1 hypothetical protein EGR_00698 [Echinococcus granulosus]KAH9280781.1 hypothetical protein ECG_07210 [Echinococcus granulosus]CDS21869.1 expressed conserved protein [Echinococcus granulosus]
MAPRTWVSLFLLTLALAVLAADMKAFRACLEVCNQRYKQCLKKTEGMWRDFHKNVNNITRIANRCCLYRANSRRATEMDSLGACARVRCNAALWGCEIRKRHEGEISQSEREHLAQEEEEHGGRSY